jgi:hypothetical protein
MTSQAEKQKRQMENSDDENTETEIVGDAVSPADAITDWGGLQARQQTRFEWSVLSLDSDDGNTAYLVNTRELDCTCKDNEHNRENPEVCKHLAAALWAADRNIGTDELSRWSLQHELKNAREAAEKVEHLSHYLQTVAGSLDGEAASEAVESDDSSTESTTSDAEMEAAAEAAEKLQAAFDDVLDDMQVEHNDGLVWFQTGQDTPDDWPFPGGDQTFKVVTQPDSVMYVHDGSDDWADGPHKHYESKPGEWWKNALDPDDVDDYIAEVLE